ncbi:hypothetical protein Q5752_004211 [Cryptotrichosporon argae]
MRFAPFVLAATALFGTVFSVPVAKKEVATRDVDYVSVVAALRADISSAIGNIADVTVVADVSAGLGNIHDLLSSALTSLDISADVAATISVRDLKTVAARDDVTSEVATILGTIVSDVADLVDRVADAVLEDPLVLSLLGDVDAALAQILNGLDDVLSGVLSLVEGILADLGINLPSLLDSFAGTLAEVFSIL